MSTRRPMLLTVVLFSALALGVVPGGSAALWIAPRALAQNLGQRTVSGTVLDDKSDPVSGAVVFLKNDKTKTIRSYTSMANGHFYFAQVDKAQDFDLWAEKSGRKSEVKTVSSWDSRTDFVTDLKLK